MTAQLKKAFAKAALLPKELQEELARQLLEDIEGELKWEETLAKSQPLLNKMAAEARREKRAGKTVPKGFDEL